MAKKSSIKDGLLKELATVAKELDEEGIGFLIDQANVLKYNKEVDRLNAGMEKRRQLISKSKEQQVTGKVGERTVDIQAAADKSSFILLINNSRKILTREELRTMVSIAHNGELAELFRWLKRERADILTDSAIKNKNDRALALISELLVSRYKVKK